MASKQDVRTVRESSRGSHWIAAVGGRPGFWTTDDIEIKERRAEGHVVLEAADGRSEGVTGSAHLADVMDVTGRVQELEGVTFAIIEGLIGLGVMAQRIENAAVRVHQRGAVVSAPTSDVTEQQRERFDRILRVLELEEGSLHARDRRFLMWVASWMMKSRTASWRPSTSCRSTLPPAA